MSSIYLKVSIADLKQNYQNENGKTMRQICLKNYILIHGYNASFLVTNLKTRKMFILCYLST